MLKDNATKLIFIGLAILLVSMTRLVPHVANFTAVGAMAIFGGAMLRTRWIAFLAPVAAMFITDLVLNNIIYASYFDSFQLITPGFGWTMVALATMVLSGKLILKKVSSLGVLGASVSASLLFFLISNFGVWASGTTYTKDLSGLILCYEMGLPFLLNTFLGTVAYSAVLFGAYKFASNKLPQLSKELA